MRLRHDIKPRVELRITPQLITWQNLLQCSTLEVESQIREEIEQNAALDFSEGRKCPQCGKTVQGPCPRCDGGEARLLKEGEMLASFDGSLPYPAADDETPPIPAPAEQSTLSDHLRLQIQLLDLDEARRAACDVLVAYLETDGSLRVPFEEISDKSGIPADQLAAGLEILQGLDPPGVGWRTPQECLLLQLKAWPPEEVDLVARLIRECWPELIDWHYEAAAEKLGLTPDAVADLVQFIQSKLTTNPARTFETAPENIHYLQPDIIIHAEGDNLAVEVPEVRLRPVRLNPLYAQLLDQLKRHPEKFDEEEKKHILNYVERAKNFIRALEQRRLTLIKIAETLVEAQRDFLLTGDKKTLQSMTQSDLARACGLSESTISRAVGHKSVQLPWGQLVPISFFLSGNTAIKERMRKVILQENPDCPYSDSQIAQIFTRAGMKLSRRTVAKYRSEMGIPSHAKRKRLGVKWRDLI